MGEWERGVSTTGPGDPGTKTGTDLKDNCVLWERITHIKTVVHLLKETDMHVKTCTHAMEQ